MTNCFLNILAFTVSIFLVSMQLAYAGQHAYHSDCGYQNSKEAMATLDLGPWFDNFEKSLKEQPKYKDFISELHKHFYDNQNLKCTFKVGKEGELISLKLDSSSENNELDNKLISLIENVDFDKPENNLTEVRGIEIEFWKAGNKIYFWSQLNRKTRSIPYDFVNYSGPKSIYPCKSRTKELDKGFFRGSFGHKLAE